MLSKYGVGKRAQTKGGKNEVGLISRDFPPGGWGGV
jgi:hypothetical protein